MSINDLVDESVELTLLASRLWLSEPFIDFAIELAAAIEPCLSANLSLLLIAYYIFDPSFILNYY